VTTDEQELSAATLVAVDEAPKHSRLSIVGLWKWALEMARFLVVGGVAFVVDMGLFNLLVFGPGQVLGDKTTTANIISVTTATIVSWVGNRYWTFKDKRTGRQGRAMVIYAAINVVGALVPIGTVALTHYTFGLTSALAMNAAKVAGIVLGTAVRYVGYKLWVFTDTAEAEDDEAAKTAASQL
jgi:putative flippase GtrA